MLKGKVAVITGGTRGIGYATVKKFLENGATVVLFGSRQETVDKALTSLKEENPDWPVSGAWPDLGNADAVAEEIGKIKETYGKIDILINNAGMSDSKPITDYTSDHFEKIMKLNVGAAMNCIMPTVKIMKEQGGVDRDDDRDDKAHIVLGTLVKFLGKRHNVHAMLAKRGAYRRSRGCLAGRDLKLDKARNLLSHLFAPPKFVVDDGAAVRKISAVPPTGAMPLAKAGAPACCLTHCSARKRGLSCWKISPQVRPGPAPARRGFPCRTWKR